MRLTRAFIILPSSGRQETLLCVAVWPLSGAGGMVDTVMAGANHPRLHAHSDVTDLAGCPLKQTKDHQPFLA